ncbi:flippase [Patescibacteria group bacterium]|nr:flippase [Patescibacteria group bacterium]
MSDTKKVAENSVIQMLGKIFSMIFGVVGIGIMTRYLGQEGFGKYTTIITFTQIFTVFLDLGLSNVTLKMISHENDENTENIISKIFTLRFFLNFLIFLAPVVVFLFPYSSDIKQGILISSFAFFFTNLIQILVVLLQKKLNTISYVIGEVFSKLIFLLSVIYVATNSLELKHILIFSILSNFIYFINVFIGARKYSKIKLKIDLKFWKKALIMCWPFAISIILNLIYFRGDTFILSLLKPQADVGIYGAAYKVLEIYDMFPILFVNLVLPILDRSYKQGDFERFKRIIQKIFDFFLMIAIPLVFGGLLLSKDIIILVAGEDFVKAGSVLQILILAMSIITFGALFCSLVIAVNKQKKMTIGYITAAILSIIGYLILIPRYSYFGAAITTVVVELIVTIFAVIIFKKETKFLPNIKSVYKILFSSIIMFIFIYLLKYKLNLDIFITLPSGVIIYFISLYLTGGINREILNELKAKNIK